MYAERPPIQVDDVANVLESPDSDFGGRAFKWISRRTVICYYDETKEFLEVRSVSATQRRLGPQLPSPPRPERPHE